MTEFSRGEFLKMLIAGVPGILFPTILNASPFPKGNKYPVTIFSKHLQWLNYKDMAALAKKMGFDGVDLTVRPGGHVLPENAEKDLPRAVNAIHDKGIKVYSITTNITDPDDILSTRIISTASELGIKYYRMGWFKYKDATNVENKLVHIRSAFQKLEELNRKYNIHGAYQNHAGNYFGAGCFDLWYLLKDLDPAYIGCQYDIRHATVERPESWPVSLELLAPYIKTIDIKDFKWKLTGEKPRAINTPLGEGVVDFDRFFSLLKKFNIEAVSSLHIEYDAGGSEHGSEKLSISKEEFVQLVKKDLGYLNNLVKIL